MQDEKLGWHNTHTSAGSRDTKPDAWAVTPLQLREMLIVPTWSEPSWLNRPSKQIIINTKKRTHKRLPIPSMLNHWNQSSKFINAAKEQIHACVQTDIIISNCWLQYNSSGLKMWLLKYINQNLHAWKLDPINQSSCSFWKEFSHGLLCHQEKSVKCTE